MKEDRVPETVAEIALVLFIGMGPIKVIVFYLGAIREATPAVAREVVLRAVGAATIAALGLVLAGWLLMRLLHFSTTALILAGGIVLLAYGLQMVLVTTPGGPVEVAPTRDELRRMAVYPMAVPLILNPAGVAATTIFSAEATSLGDLGVVILIVAAMAALDVVVLLAVRPLGPRLGPEIITVLEKLLGVLLAAVAVELILIGLGQLGLVTAGSH
jgi:small neutral amino acid transporter SnatA (MarC family)